MPADDTPNTQASWYARYWLCQSDTRACNWHASFLKRCKYPTPLPAKGKN